MKIRCWIIDSIFILLLSLLVTSFLGCSERTDEAKDIRIGAILPLTGDGALYGQMARKAIELAVEEINAKKGTSEKKFSVVYEDSQLKPDLAVNAATKLIIADKVLAIIGPMASNEFIPVIPIAQKYKIPVISPSATSHEITKLGSFKFRTIVSDIYDGTAMAKFAFNKMGFRKAAVFYVNEAGPRGVSIAFMEEFKRLGGQIVVQEKGDRDGTDFRTQIAKIKEAGSDAVYFAGYAKETVVYLRQAKELGLEKPLMTHQLIDDPDVIKRAGETAEGVFFTTPKLTPETGGPVVKEFFDNFKNKYGETPQNFAPNVYDAMMLIAKMVEKYGDTSEGINKGFLEVRDYHGASGEMSIDENGDVVQQMRVMKIQDGKIVECNQE